MSKRVLFLVFAVAAAGAIAVPSLAAQSNEVLDAVLGQANLSYGNAAYLVGTASGRVRGHGRHRKIPCPRWNRRGWDCPGADRRDPVTLGDFSYMLTRAFGIHGGLMYWVLPSPRYATRELAYLDIISGPAKAGMPLSGERALRILERMLNRKEAAR